MPQLLPFYFVNQISFTGIGLFIILFIFSRYILPSFTELFIVRLFISKV